MGKCWITDCTREARPGSALCLKHYLHEEPWQPEPRTLRWVADQIDRRMQGEIDALDVMKGRLTEPTPTVAMLDAVGRLRAWVRRAASLIEKGSAMGREPHTPVPGTGEGT